MIRHDGRVAIVTGAGKGLGRAYALALAARGARIVVNNRRRLTDTPGDSSAERTVAAIRAAGGEAVANFDDVLTPSSGPYLVAQAKDTWGRLDIIVNNAGVGQHLNFQKITLDEWRAIFDLNFYGSLYLTHAAWPALREQRFGRIVVSASSAGLHGLHGLTAYAASKAALIGLMRSLAQEGAGRNVLCNAICPYATTAMTVEQSTPEMIATMTPELVAPLVSYLVSDQTKTNGRVIVAGKGAFRRAVMVEGPGVAYARSAEVTPESIAADIEGIDSLAAPRDFPDALAAFDQFYQTSPGVL
jgi:NAD(P)-dependent dehydrogenase (short-subunit alcohol dehydrogenase family)